MFGKLEGKKTYVVATLSILGALAGYLTGEVQMMDAVHLVETAVIGACLRNGIK